MPDDRPAKLRILIVEDEAMVRLMLAEMLAELGHQVVAQASKLEMATGVARTADYDLAILDLNLGDGPSNDVLDIVLERGKPLVVSTGYGAGGLGARYANCVVLPKPFRQAGLDRAISQALQNRPGLTAEARNEKPRLPLYSASRERP